MALTYLSTNSTFTFSVSYNFNGTGGNTPPSDNTYKCAMPLEYVTAFKVTPPPGTENGQPVILPAKDSIAKLHTSDGAGYTYWTGEGPIGAGMLVKKSFPTLGPKIACVFVRTSILLLKNPDTGVVLGQIWTVKTLSDNSLYDQAVEAEAQAAANTKALTKTRVSRPVVPYGTAAVAGEVSKDTTVKEILEKSPASAECKGPCDTSDPIKAYVPWQNKPTAYHHASPDKLARDNPACAAGPYNPTCAWKESDTPIDPQTQDKKDLVRMSNDGQTIVNNNTSVYNNTTYPPGMVQAGTAPAGGGQGTESSPDRPEGAEGDPEATAKFVQCLRNPDDCGGEDTDMTGDAEGAFAEGMGEPTTVAGRILQDAINSGKCNGTTDRSYCTGLAAIAGLGDYPYNPNEDFVISEGMVHGQNLQYKIPASVMDFLWLIGQLGSLWAGIHIVLRGKRPAE